MNAKSEEMKKEVIEVIGRILDFNYNGDQSRLTRAGDHSRCLDYVYILGSYHISEHNVSMYMCVKPNCCLETEYNRALQPALKPSVDFRGRGGTRKCCQISVVSMTQASERLIEQPRP